MLKEIRGTYLSRIKVFAALTQRADAAEIAVEMNDSPL